MRFSDLTALVCLSSCFGYGLAQEARSPETVIARVDGEPIRYQEMQAEQWELRTEYFRQRHETETVDVGRLDEILSQLSSKQRRELRVEVEKRKLISILLGLVLTLAAEQLKAEPSRQEVLEWVNRIKPNLTDPRKLEEGIQRKIRINTATRAFLSKQATAEETYERYVKHDFENLEFWKAYLASQASPEKLESEERLVELLQEKGPEALNFEEGARRSLLPKSVKAEIDRRLAGQDKEFFRILQKSTEAQERLAFEESDYLRQKRSDWWAHFLQDVDLAILHPDFKEAGDGLLHSLSAR